MNLLFLLALWIALFFFSVGIIGINLIIMKKNSKKPWNIKASAAYKPKVTIIVPTYNESNCIGSKLVNLVKLDYPRELMQIVFVDSNSNDGTMDIITDFVKQQSTFNFTVLSEKERKGKSAALNFALQYCTGDVIVVSDSDSYWYPDILEKTMPFLADPSVGAISGPKILLNPNQTWVTKTETLYLNSLNSRRLGESKLGSTLLFEGGFSAFKRNILTSFDQYNTGSDDNGTVIGLIENNQRTLFLPEAKFFTFFPETWKEKTSIKTRRANQIVRVYSKYASLLLKNRIKSSKGTVFQHVFFNIVSPFMFVGLLALSVLMVIGFPYFLILLLILLVPNVALFLAESVQSYIILFFSILSVAAGKKFIIWKIPKRKKASQEEETLRRNGLI